MNINVYNYDIIVVIITMVVVTMIIKSRCPRGIPKATRLMEKASTANQAKVNKYICVHSINTFSRLKVQTSITWYNLSPLPTVRGKEGGGMLMVIFPYVNRPSQARI